MVEPPKAEAMSRWLSAGIALPAMKEMGNTVESEMVLIQMWDRDAIVTAYRQCRLHGEGEAAWIVMLPEGSFGPKKLSDSQVRRWCYIPY